MPNCDWIELIDEHQCVGDSLDIINANFVALQDVLCSLYALFPPGLIVLYSGTTAPSGWHICDGTYISQSTYPQLYALIGTTYGTVSGSSFKLPDMRGRTAVGVKTPNHPLAQIGGTETVSLTSGQNAAHTHVVTDPGHTHVAPTSATSHTHGITDPGHTHGISEAGHAHQVFYGQDTTQTGWSTLSARQVPQTRAASTDEITYGNAHVASIDPTTNSSTSVYYARHSIGPYWNNTTLQNTCPNAYWFTSVNPGGGATQVYLGDTATNYWFANVESKTTANPLQVTIKAADSNVTLVAAQTQISINNATVPITINSHTTGITIASTGSGNPHNNMQPYIALNYIIKLV